jgi:hypothetical protein
LTATTPTQTAKALNAQAVNALPDMARESLPNGPNRMFRVEVREPAGKVVFRATLELKSEWL